MLLKLNPVFVRSSSFLRMRTELSNQENWHTDNFSWVLYYDDFLTWLSPTILTCISSLPPVSGISVAAQKNAEEFDLWLLKNGTFSILSCANRRQRCVIFACCLNDFKFHLANLKRCKNVIKNCQPILNYSHSRLEGRIWKNNVC